MAQRASSFTLGSHESIQEIIRNDMTIKIMRICIEGLFGGLWILLIITLLMVMKDILRVLIVGSNNPKDRRADRHLYDRRNQISIFLFSSIATMMTIILVTTEMGRRMLSAGLIVFLVGGLFYYSCVMPSSKDHVLIDEYTEYRERLAEMRAESQRSDVVVPGLAVGKGSGRDQDGEGGEEAKNRRKGKKGQ